MYANCQNNFQWIVFKLLIIIIESSEFTAGFERIHQPLFVELLMLFLTNLSVLGYMLKIFKNKYVQN